MQDGANNVAFLYSEIVQDEWTLEVTRDLSVTEEYLELLGHWLAVKGGDRVLDMGCGTGTMLRKLLQRFPKISGLGVDSDRAYVAAARRLAVEAGLESRLEFEVGDVRALSCADRAANSVFCHAVLQVVPDGRKALDEAARVVEPGGRVVLMLPIVECPHPVMAQSFPQHEKLNDLEAEAFCQHARAMEHAFGASTTVTWGNVQASVEAAGLEHVFTRGLFCPLDIDALGSAEFARFVTREALVLKQRARRLVAGHPRLDEMGALYDARAKWLIEQRDSGSRCYGWSGVPLLVLVCTTKN